MKKYSKVYITEGEKLFGYRYNYTDCVLECVSKWDCEFNDKHELVDIELPEWKAYDSIGLSVGEWKENPEYWIDQFRNEQREEVAHMVL